MIIGSRIVLIASAFALSLGLPLASGSFAQEKKDMMGKDETKKGGMSSGEMKKAATGKDSVKKDDKMMKKDEMKK